MLRRDGCLAHVPARSGPECPNAAEVLAVEVLHYRLGDKTAHCSDDGKGGLDCDVTPAEAGPIWEARPGYVSSAYVELGLSDHRVISLRCEPGHFVWSNQSCYAPEKGQAVQVEFKGKHAIVAWDVNTQKILSVNKIKNKTEHRSERYEIVGVAENRYFGSVRDLSPRKR